MKNFPRRTLVASVLCLALAEAAAHSHVHQLADLADLSLEQLTQVTVTSASRREQRLVEAAASIFVITRDDIRRSGVTSLPEALRLAPNLQVMRGDTSQYVVSARGGLTPTANKMLVLVDGRTVYTPLFSGVFYDALTIALEDVDRIEVISGPGSTLWGTNAVNGVINVISRPAGETVGGLAAVVAGEAERGVQLRQGWATPTGAMRVYARYYDRDEHRLGSGAPARDDAKRGNVGLRGDWERGADALSVHANFYDAEVNNLAGAREMAGGYVMGRWRRALAADSELWVQAFVNRAERLHTGSFEETRDTAAVEAQRAMRLAAHRLAFGFEYRASRDDTTNTPALGFMPAARTLSYASLYAQDEIELAAQTRLTLGLRAERNSYTGVEWLPTLRLSHALAADQFVWGAITRTVRSPSRLDRDLVVPGQPPFVVINNSSFVSEVANVAEIGYRANLTSKMTLSLTAFHHRFTDLRTLEPVAQGGFMLANGGRGEVSGIEGWGDFRPSPAWRLAWGFTVMRDRFELPAGRVNLSENPLGNNPRRTAMLRSQTNLGSSVELDLMLRYVAALRDPAVPSYTELAARLGWRVSPRLELSLAAMNALDREHAEFGSPTARAVFDRAVMAKAVWAF
jgi:iron complex outermembrane recepter protein